MDDLSQEMMIQRAKAIAEIKMIGHGIMPDDDEMKQAAFILSGEGNRKQRRAFAARNRMKDK